MRRSLVLLFAAAMFAGPLAGCLGGAPAASDDAEAKRIQAQGKSTPVFPGDYKFDGAYSQVLAEGPHKYLKPQQTFIKSKIDGVDIEIGYWLPDVPEGTKVPVIVDASPYHRGNGNVISLRGQLLFLVDNFLPHGYAVAGVSTRGTGNSGGCMDLMGPKETKDLDQAITWLGEQAWSNGNVAMIGVSYEGSTPWSVASTGNPHLKTIVPISGLPDIFGLMYRNGSSEQRGAFLVNAIYYTYGPSPDDVPSQNQSSMRTTQHRAEGTACPDYAVGLAGAGWSAIVGDRDPTNYWQDRNRKPAIEKNYRGSILLVQGLQDWNVDPSLVIPWVNTLNASGAPLKQMLGQWGHANPDRPTRLPGGSVNPVVRFDWAEILLHWFDKYLKEIPGVETGPNVQIQDSTMRWHNEEFYPPRDAAWNTLHLSSGGKLALEPGAAGSVLLTPTPLLGPASAQFRSLPGYSADFSLVAGENGLHFAGLPRLHVTVTPHGPTGHLMGGLYDVDEKGAEKLVGRTTMNLWYADGTETRKPTVPNQPVLAKMEFQPLDVYIAPGHRLLVRVWEATDTDRLPAIPPEPVTLSYGGSIKSTLELPVLERGEDAFFKPPMPPAN